MKQGWGVNGKLLRHKWTEEDRIVLALLFRFYSNTDDDRLRIWNHIHKEVLASEGYPDSGYGLQPMLTQVDWMKRGGAGSQIWKSVREVPLHRARQAFSTHKDVIEEAAQQLRIQLKLRLGTPQQEVAPVKQAPANKPMPPKAFSTRSSQHIATARADEWSSSSDEDDEDQNSPCARRHMTLNPSFQRQKTLNATLIRSFAFDAGSQDLSAAEHSPKSGNRQQTDDYLNIGRPQDRPRLVAKNLSSPGTPRQPTLLFRAFLPGHGFKARKFLAENKRAPPPPPMASETFLEMVDPHLRQYLPENATYLSPFISLTESPGRALKFVHKKQLPHSLAVFEANAISKDGKDRYGDVCIPYPYLVPGICKTHEIDDLPGKYVGNGEFLAYGSIECQPIAVLDNNTAKQLLRIMTALSTSGQISWRSGQLVGPLLASVDDTWKETVAYKLIRNFKVKGYLSGAKGRNYDDFVDAVYQASRGNRAASVFGEADEVTPPKTRIVVEIPAPPRRPSANANGNGNGNGKDKGVNIEWQPVTDDQSGKQISVAMPKPNTFASADGTPSTSTSSEEAGDFQSVINVQLQSDATDYGIGVDRWSPASGTPSTPITPPSLFLQELQQQAALLTPPPIPPLGYQSSPVEPTAVCKSSSETMVIDLCSEDEDNEDEQDDDIRELPTFDLTQDQDNDNNGDDEDDLSIIAAAIHRGGGSGRNHSALSIRSRSLSNAVSTPTKPPKKGRGGGRKINTR